MELVLNDVEYSSDDRSEDAVVAVVVLAVLGLAVVAVFVTALEAFAEVVVVFVKADVMAVVTK